MRWAEGFIAAAWGTTNRRAYLMDGQGKCVDEFEDDKGILGVPKGGFTEAVAEIRERLGDKPLLLAGMVGSNRGWIEAPYVPCPAGIEDLAANLVWPEEGRTAIVPGVSFVDPDEADVMRGEEVQLVGAIAAGQIPRDCLVCHPGTHNKWVRVRNGRIESFRTVMTGELFSMLKKRSILSDLLARRVTPREAFREGVARGLSGAGITSELFEVRAGFLLGQIDPADGASRVSGLLIGEDIRVGLAEKPGARVIVMGRPELTSLYSSALEVAGIESESLDGEGAFIAGARNIVEQIQ
jgi:2-dehydro-3-deoxygalactonokinase